MIDEDKLREWGLDANDIDLIIDELVETDFINEKRYLVAFVRGKFYSNKWGKGKIKSALLKKKFREDDIQEALKKLDPSEYMKAAEKLIVRKMEKHDLNDRKEKSKVYYYMLSKGYESDIVVSIFKKLMD